MEQIRDPLYARAVVVKCGGETLAILTADVISITRAFADRIRRGAAEILGTKPEAVLCHATQTHSGPFVGNAMITDDYPLPADLWWLRGGDERYNEPFVRGMLRAVEQAKSSLQPASLKAGRGIDGRVAFNRRYIMRDGTGRDVVIRGEKILFGDFYQTIAPPTEYCDFAAGEHADADADSAMAVEPAEERGQGAAGDLADDRQQGIDGADLEHARDGAEIDHHAHGAEKDGNKDVLQAFDFLLDDLDEVGAGEGEAHDVGADDHGEAGHFGEAGEEEGAAEGEGGDGAHCRHLHLLVDRGRAAVERAPEDIGEAEDVVDLVGEVRAAGADHFRRQGTPSRRAGQAVDPGGLPGGEEQGMPGCGSAAIAAVASAVRGGDGTGPGHAAERSPDAPGVHAGPSA